METQHDPHHFDPHHFYLRRHHRHASPSSLMAAYGNPAQGQSTPSVGFESSNISPTIQEPDLSPYRVNVTFNVELSQASSQTITVRYHTVDETAHAAQRDYTATSGTLYFSPGTTQRTITVTVLNDTNVENFERFGVELSQPTNATIGANNEVVIIIADNDESAPYNLIAPATVRENQGTFTFSVKTASSPRVEKTARLLIYSTPGTAEVGDDYTYFSKIVALEPGTTGSNFTVALGNDDTDEPDETFFLRLFHPGTTDPQIILGVTEVTVTILDDDPAVPTNLELASQTTDDDLDHVAVLQWDYSDAEGYLLESQRRRQRIPGTVSWPAHTPQENPPAPARSAPPGVEPWPPAPTGTSGSGTSPHRTVLLPRRGHLRRGRE